MSWKDELNYAKNIFKNGTPKEKWEYFWDYYKWHTIVLVLIIGFLGNVIYSNVTAKDYVLQGFFLNTYGNEDAGESLKFDYLESFPLNSDKEDVFFTTNYYVSLDDDSETLFNSYETLSMITAKLAAKEIDFMVSDLKTMNYLAYREFAIELPELLTAEQLEKYEPYFLYYDRAFMEKLNDTDIETMKEVVYPDPQKPELMEDPVPMLIDISRCEALEALYPSSEKDYAIFFVANSENQERNLQFLEYLMQ